MFNVLSDRCFLLLVTSTIENLTGIKTLRS
jgi:hypothetical protein